LKIYRPQKIKKLFVSKTFIRGPRGVANLNLLVDTGATYPLIDTAILQQTGYDPAVSTDRIQITTANGRITVPRIRVAQIHSLGQIAENCYVFAQTFSQESYFDGLLGMDFLERFPIEIRPYSEEIIVRA
jgi:clan AA aspartic protease (TIGR02281 family)